MSAFENPAHKGRLILIPKVRDAFADLHFSAIPSGSEPTIILGLDSEIEAFLVKEPFSESEGRDVYNFPFLFHEDGTPWVEANSFLLSLVSNRSAKSRPTDDVRRKAAKLLDYLVFCEENGINWLDFSGKRPSHRPIYRYFKHLLESGSKSNPVINQFTGVVYSFYKFVAKYWCEIDIERVDTVKTVRIQVETVTGGLKSIPVEKRGQTKSVSRNRNVPLGYVIDEGECLRPLMNLQLAELLNVIRLECWSAQERLMILFSLLTGARKQSVLTLRVRHVRDLLDSKLQPEGAYILRAGPGTGIDTKFGKPQRLHVPVQLAEELNNFVDSELSTRRRSDFAFRYAREYPDLKRISEDDMYVFISEQSNCYYMAVDDPRYPFVKTKPAGQVTETLKRKILRFVSEEFPRAFSFHWLRATFAYQYYQYLVPFLKSGRLQSGEEISILQYRLHHENRETTENYLKLFLMVPEKIRAQEDYEDVLFGFSGIDCLKLIESEA